MQNLRGLLSAMNLKVLKNLAFLATVLGVVVAPAAHTFAQSNGLGITPELNYTVKAGTQLSDTLYVNNLSTSQPLNLKLSAVDFEPQGENGTPKILLGGNAPQTPWSLKPYLTLPDFVTINPGTSQLIPFTVKIPAGVGAGSYYSAVQYSALSSNNSQKVSVTASADTLMFVTVPGKATEQLSMQQFGAESKIGGNFKNIFSSPPSSFAYRVKNNGNVAESPAGSIVIKNIFGHITAHIDNANPRSQLVLIGQTRKFEVCNPKATDQRSLNNPNNCKALSLKPGLYTAEIEILYGQNGQPSQQISAKSMFWYLPLWFVIVFVLVLLAIAYGIYFIYLKITAPKHRHKR